MALADEDDRPSFVPQAFPSLRRVPAYARFVAERFERCLDLYLCPRARRKRVHVAGEEGRGPLCVSFQGEGGKAAERQGLAGCIYHSPMDTRVS